jgi:hypothetical protein
MAERKITSTPIVTLAAFLLVFVPLSAYATKSAVEIDIDPNYHTWENFMGF